MKKWILNYFFFLGCSIIHASQPGIYTNISTGVDFIRTNGNQRLILLTPYEDYYTGNYSYKASASLGFGLGLERALYSNLMWQAGFSGYFNGAVSASGHHWLFSLPDFDNFSYRYQIQSSRVVVSGKLLSGYHQKYHPYLSAELGASFNHTYCYKETPLIEEELPMAAFTPKVNGNFTYGVGMGMDVDIHSSFRLGVGYQFVDLGKASLGVSPSQETQQTLTINHLYDNQVRIQLTALI